MANVGIFQLLVVAVIIILLFGTKRLRHLGGDLGYAIKSFRRSVAEHERVDPRKDSDTVHLSDHQSRS